MSPTFTNEAAWIVGEKVRPLKVGPGPVPNPAEYEVVIKVAYAAVNPTDWKMQDTPYFEIKYPFIFGTDVAGTVVQLGSKVTKFEIGQRVIGHCDSLISRKVTNSGYQRYATVQELLVSQVPDSIPLVNAAVIPLAFTTASSALFYKLGLPLPSLKPEPTGQTILIWGGSSSCGATAIQLAVAAGLNVLATASPANHALVKSLGASQVFDHKDPNIVEKVLRLLKKGDYVFDCISAQETQAVCGDILGQIGGGKLPVLYWPAQGLPENVEIVFVNGLDPAFVAPEIGQAVWGRYLPGALAAGKFLAKPDPFIVEGGLESVQEGIDLQRSGVSAKKIVIEIAKDCL